MVYALNIPLAPIRNIRDRPSVDMPNMKTKQPVAAEGRKSAFPYINGINMEIAVELLGQEIAKRVTAIDDEEKGHADPDRIRALQSEVSALWERQRGLRSEDVAGVQAVFDEYGRSGGSR